MAQRIRFFDLLRCVAAVAVIAIHVLAPYRDALGQIPFNQWFTAVGINSITRWAVPVFILITGALMLSDKRDFELGYYVKRRLGKVLVPFLVWSLFYAYLSGWGAHGFDSQHAFDVLVNSPHHATYYHLGFFYYFIPLYFVIPFFQWLVKRGNDEAIYAFVAIWLVTSLLYLLRIDGPWSHQMWLYSGYLPFGYVLFNKVPMTKRWVSIVSVLGVIALAVTVWMVVQNSLVNGEYTVGRWLSYKTFNVILAASMVFVLCRAVSEHLSDKAHNIIALVSRHSLGIYILHPIFLWPMKAFGWYQGHPAWVIPLWVMLSGLGALALSSLLARSKATAWLLP
ncbi:acyltransferase [Vibrio sp. LaRot3]|uniref:acyltransferase n=1 Tax=Vibrio sp. LaRot3 TaxID=2998829 RepID=UPI0022CDC039|nr:acyltransferase family protein [Vibrio sp. LaRot3]MDA0150318.1 acyltransferase family protein [Vibrio sp. LaRot3]